jgi:Domain of unknown function (DUF4440)
MIAGARSPEELDPLLEDAFVLRDRAVTGLLFDDRAVLAEAGGPEVRGGRAIGRALDALWARDVTYVARPRRIVRTGATALVVAGSGIHVLHRDGGGTWRSTISLLDLDTSDQQEDA